MYCLSFIEFIDIGWESPAGQTYSTVSDLAKVMMLVFSNDKPANKSTGQVCFVSYTCS